MRLIGKIILFLMFFAFVSTAYAEQVIIFNFNYDNGVISLKDQIVKDGYYPDRNIQPYSGYKCQLKNDADRSLYSMKFEIPVNIFLDATDNDRIVGGTIVLNETDFSLVMPYLSEADNIVCYNKRGYEVIRAPIFHTVRLSPDNNRFIGVYLAMLLIVILFAAYFLKRRSNK